MIGTFDSGLGGTLLLKSISDQTNADILYVGDRKNHPYGSKSDEEIIALFTEQMHLFQKRGVKEVVIACNTLCSTIDFNAYPGMKLYDIIQKTADQVNLEKDASILVVATPKTVEKGRYSQCLKARGYENVQEVGLDKLAVYVEQFEDEKVVYDYLKEELKGYKPDLIILACTHYPVYKHLFKDLFNCKVIDSTQLIFNFDEQNGSKKIMIDMEQNPQIDRFLKHYVNKEYCYYEDCTSI